MNNEKDQRTEQVLNSLDGVKRAAAPAFFYTRLKARLEREMGTVAGRPWVLRPVFAVATLVIILAINASVVFQNNSGSEVTVNTNDAESIQMLAAEYSVTDAGSIYDLNPEK